MAGDIMDGDYGPMGIERHFDDGTGRNSPARIIAIVRGHVCTLPRLSRCASRIRAKISVDIDN